MPKNLLLLLLTLLFSTSSLLLTTLIKTPGPEQKNYNLVFGPGPSSKDKVLGTNTVIFDTTEDTYGESSTPTTTHGSETYMKTKHYTPSGPDADSFLKFDLSSIQANSTINSAILKLQLYACWGEPTAPAWITVAQAASNWLAATLTWNNMPGTASQRNFSAAADCPPSPPSPQYNKGYVNMEVAYLVQQWVNGEKPNYGFIVLNRASTTTYWKMWSTKESSFKPKLEVTWTTPPAAPPPAPPAGDTIAPIISSVATKDVTKNSATISWTTNEASSSFVDYGLTSSYGSNAGQADSVTSHQVSLSGLESDKTFHFRVRSKDAANNEATSSDFSFKTLAASSQAVSPDDASKATDLERASTLSSTASGKKATGQTEKGKSSFLKWALIGTIVLMVALLIGLALYLWLRKQRTSKIEIGPPQGNVQPPPVTQNQGGGNFTGKAL
jgi:hypothetical protein